MSKGKSPSRQRVVQCCFSLPPKRSPRDIYAVVSLNLDARAPLQLTTTSGEAFRYPNRFGVEYPTLKRGKNFAYTSDDILKITRAMREVAQLNSTKLDYGRALLQGSASVLMGEVTSLGLASIFESGDRGMKMFSDAYKKYVGKGKK